MIKLGAFVVVLALAFVGCGGNVVVDSYDLNAAEQAPAPECDPEDGTDPACDDSDDCTADRCSPDGACAHSPIGGCAEG